MSFYTAEDGVFYNIVVYDRFEGGELLEELTSTHGIINHTGFHTIDLDRPVKLVGGDDFYIYLQLLGGGHPYDRTSEVPVLLGAQSNGVIVESNAHPGESYYRKGLQWLDLYEYEDILWPGTANFCIKGLTEPLEIQVEISGGYGITATVRNTGDSDLSNLEWSIDISGLVLLQQNHEGVISSLAAGSETSFSSGLVIGIGPGNLKVIVGDLEKKSEIFMIGPFFIIR